MAKDFAVKEIQPTLKDDEANHRFRPEIVKKMAELGFFGCALPEEYGGNGFGFLESVIIAEQIAKVSGSWRLPFNMQNIGPAVTVNKFGSEEQKQRFIPDWVNANSFGFFAITEPNSGSDVAGMGTTAVDCGDHWKITGQKMWISNAQIGDWGVVYAFTDKTKKYKGMTCFIVNLKDNEGIIAAPIETKLGLQCAPTGEISFNKARIPKDSVLGEVGQGFQVCMFQLNNTRISCSAGALGIAGGAIDAAIDYANERTQFGKKIGSYQLIQGQILISNENAINQQTHISRPSLVRTTRTPSQLLLFIRCFCPALSKARIFVMKNPGQESSGDFQSFRHRRSTPDMPFAPGLGCYLL